MIGLDILTIGSLERDAEGNILQAHSTATLIRTDDRVIVVDTSSKDRTADLKTAFKQLMVLPKDVDTVVLTHSHSDHIGNNKMFPKAEFIIHSGEKGEIPGARIIDEDTELTKGVKLVHTPGHTHGSMSVFIDADIKYVIAGDTVPLKENVLKLVPPGINYDAKLALQSLKKVIDYADMVIPGHDYPFMTDR
jgi:N-acyl homoserine lactone hydrolase